MLQFLLNFYISGLDTIIAGLQWSLFYLIKFPDIQVKIHQEIGTVHPLCSNNSSCMTEEYFSYRKL